MDSTAYRDIVKHTLLEYAELRPSHGDIRLDVVFDDVRTRYALMQIGWDRGRRVSSDLVYITLDDSKVYIEYDGIEHGVADSLISRGIPPDHCILAYVTEEVETSVTS